MAPKKVKEEPIDEEFLDGDCLDLHAEFSGMNGNIKDENYEETFLRILQGDSESPAEMEMGASGSEDVSVSLFTQNKGEKGVPILNMNLPGTSDPNEGYQEMMWNLETQETEKLNIKVEQKIDPQRRENQPKSDLNADFIAKKMQERIHRSSLYLHTKRKDDQIVTCIFSPCNTKVSMKDPEFKEMTVVPFEKAKKLHNYLKRSFHRLMRKFTVLNALNQADKECGFMCIKHIKEMVEQLHYKETEKHTCSLCNETVLRRGLRLIYNLYMAKEMDEIFDSTPKLYNEFQKLHPPLKNTYHRLYHARQKNHRFAQTFICKKHFTEEIRQALQDQEMKKKERIAANKHWANTCCFCGHSNKGNDFVRKHWMTFSRNKYDHEYFDKVLNAGGKIIELKAKHSQLTLCMDHITDEMWQELKHFRATKNRDEKEAKSEKVDRTRTEKIEKESEEFLNSLNSNQLNGEVVEGLVQPKMEESVQSEVMPVMELNSV